MPSAVSGRQCPAESPAKKTPASAAVPQPVRDPVALVADGVALEPLSQLDGRLLDVEARVERPDADAHLVVRGEAPAVAGRHDRAVDPDLELAARAGGCTSRPRESGASGRLVAGARAPAASRARRRRAEPTPRRGRSRP